MLVDPKLDEVVNGARGMLAGVRTCLDSQCLVSAVTLMFSSVDALAALTRPIDEQSTNGDVFKSWVTRYIKPKKTLGCTTDELWGARCGVLHLYSPESRLSAQSKARRIFYQWSAGPEADASRIIPRDSLVLSVETLWHAVESAAHDFILDSERDKETNVKLKAHLPSLLCYEPFPSLAVTLAP